MESRTRPTGPHEVRYLAELTGAYAKGLRDVLEVLEMAARERSIDLNRFVRLLDLIQALVAVDGDLELIAKECRVLLGES
jgi:hypothetical protein